MSQFISICPLLSQVDARPNATLGELLVSAFHPRRANRWTRTFRRLLDPQTVANFSGILLGSHCAEHHSLAAGAQKWSSAPIDARIDRFSTVPVGLEASDSDVASSRVAQTIPSISLQQRRVCVENAANGSLTGIPTHSLRLIGPGRGSKRSISCAFARQTMNLLGSVTESVELRKLRSTS